MRIPSLFGPATAGFSTFLHLAHGLSFTPVSEPDLDLGPLGQVALTGDFDAATFYSYTEQSDTPSLDDDNHGLLTPLPNGILTTLADSDASIRAMCPFTKKDGSFAGIFIGGNFTSLGGVETQGAALFNPNTTKVTALPGLSGSVSALLCDQESDRVYVGGQFKYDNTSNAAVWEADKGWSSLMFGGFNGPVTSILKDDGHIIFGGSFDGIGNATSSDKNEQIVNLQDAEITSDAETSKSGFTDPRNIICKTGNDEGEGNTWLLEDYSPGFWRADMRYEFNPTKLRLYNTHLEGRGTKSFLFRRLPDNGIMNLTYTDPETGDDVYCENYCSLSDSTDELYRDFKFVNPVGMSGFMLEVKDWYGAGAGLNGIQLYSNDILSYAVNKFNEPTCAGIEFPSKSTRSGSWTETNADQGPSDYLTAQVTDSTARDTSIVFEPDVKRSGNYSVVVYTPGCSQDGTCDSRGIVNVTATVSTDSDPIETQIYQTNQYDKYDTIYTGHVDDSDDSFRPSVTLTPVAGQGDITVVASRVRFGLIRASGGLSGELNGLYDFDPNSKKETPTDFTSSSINTAGLDLEDKASVQSLVSHDGIIYAGGNFSSSDVQNIMFLNEDGNGTAMARGGLNSKVSSMAILSDFLYVGGNFTDTSDGSNSGLKHIAAYSLHDKTWTALGGGVNGPVERVIALSLNVSSDLNETTIGVSGDFDELLEFGDNPSTSVNGFAVWVPSRKNWLQNLNITQMAFAGQLSAFTKAENITILAGNLVSGGISAGGAVALLHEEELGLTPLLAKSDSTGATYTGIYDKSSGRNLTILGGHFTTTASDGSEIRNLAILDGTEGTITGLGSGVDNNSTILTLAVAENTLYAGGNITGSLGEDTVLGGFVVYDLENGTFSQVQPPRFTGETVSVNSIAARPGSKEVYFAGQFQNAGALPCPGVCFYDSDERQWSRPGAELYGNVLAIRWMSKNTMIAVGDLNISGNKSVVATYATEGQSWETFDGASTSDIPGTVTAFSPASTDVAKFWLAGVSDDGSSFLANYNGTGFQFAEDIFDDGTDIRGLEVLPVSKDHHDVDLLNDDQILMVTGNLVIPDFGHASAALFNGTVLTPFVLTTNSDGQPGSMSQLFYENKNPYTREGKHHSNGIVVLVSFCCALGCVFLIVIAGVIFNKIQRRRQGYMPGPQTDRPSDMQRLPPEYLFNSLKHSNPAAPAI